MRIYFPCDQKAGYQLPDDAMNKPTVVIGRSTIDRLLSGSAVEFDAVTILPADDLRISQLKMERDALEAALDLEHDEARRLRELYYSLRENL